MRLAVRYLFLSGLAFALPSFLFSFVNAQERCGTVEYTRNLYPDHQIRRIEFEQWLSEKKIERAFRSRREKQSNIYKIPVVVHIIHNGEPIGTGANISDAQILSQLRVLNADFTRENADAANTPPEFADVAGSLDIEFVLARQDPEGLPTNGIVRVNGGRSGWIANDNYALKSLSYWPAEYYLNIWVCNLTDGYVGYAQLPESELQGLQGSSTNRLTDGVVIWHKAFGSIDDGPFSLDPVFNKGRTATHEVGHFFGLLHIWGDEAGCSGSDYVNDTPNQAYRTQGCPSHPRSDACSNKVMFQNFLDYTDDNCMNLFTQGQVERMTIVIENSPRRKTLLTSHALQDPEPLANDVGIRRIVFPDATVCTNDVSPVIELRNYGNNVITSAEIQFSLDGVVTETLEFPLSLDPDESVEVTFGTHAMSSGMHEITFDVLSTNGQTDAGTYNNFATATILIPTFGTVPFAEDFSTQPSGWITQNPDGQITWTISPAPGHTPGNEALKLDYYNYEDRIGEVDVFLSPVFDLSSVPAAIVTFDLAHARYQGSNDQLKVVVLTDCQDVFEGTTVYDKSGEALRTAPQASDAFTPSGPSDWRKEFIDLTAFIGANRVQLAFVGINDWGNNIYIDNISMLTDVRRDAALVKLARPSVVTATATVAPVITVGNVGSVPLNSITAKYALNDGTVQSKTFDNLDIAVGATGDVTLPDINLPEGHNILQVTLELPEGVIDDDESNNSEGYTIVLNDNRDRIPLRENFESEFVPAWTIANPLANGEMNWETVTTTFGRALYFKAFDNERLGDESWFVSPVLDFSRATQATLQFDISYHPPPGGPEESRRILVSTDGGLTFEEIVFDFPDAQTSAQGWIPTQESHWDRNLQVNLNAFVGKKDVRIAFVVRNENGNNLYIDNIEFFTTPVADLNVPVTLYSIYGYNLDEPALSDLQITFNLPERQDVRLSVVNAMGQTVVDGVLADVLNQTFPLALSKRLQPGVYVVRLHLNGRFYSSRVLVR